MAPCWAMPPLCCASLESEDDRLLIVNFDQHIRLDPAPEPLLAPPRGTLWEMLWSSEDPRYGGGGTPPLESEENWTLPAQSAVVMRPKARLPMKKLVRNIDIAQADAAFTSRTPAPRVAAHQWPWRIRFGHDLRHGVRAATTGCSSPRCRRRSGAW